MLGVFLHLLDELDGRVAFAFVAFLDFAFCSYFGLRQCYSHRLHFGHYGLGGETCYLHRIWLIACIFEGDEVENLIRLEAVKTIDVADGPESLAVNDIRYVGKWECLSCLYINDFAFHNGLLRKRRYAGKHH